MNNKGFAITGIIYTLFVLFLLILLSVLSGLSSFQKLMINSTEIFETSYEGTKIDDTEVEEIKIDGIATYTGKYIFDMTITETTIKCSAYLYKDTNFKSAFNESSKTIFLSPVDCNNYSYDYNNLDLKEIYSFEKGN